EGTTAPGDPVADPLIDTHAHLTDGRFASDFPGLLVRMRAAGVVRAVAVATTAADSADCLRLARAHPDQLSPTAGIHPNEAAAAGCAPAAATGRPPRPPWRWACSSPSPAC